MTEKSTIYLDYASTTPVDPRVASKMMEYLTPDGEFGNPASRSHRYGWKADDAVEEARSHVANLVNADPREIVWTSGATEADNLAVKGVARFYKSKGNHIITSKIEHKAVLDPCRQLEREGFEVTYLEPNEFGIIQPEQVQEAIKESTILVSLMHINNELIELSRGIDAGFRHLVCGGRIGILSFHSLEHAAVRKKFRALVRPVAPRRLPVRGTISGRAVYVIKAKRPEPIETNVNPRSRSALLQVVERIE